MLEALPDAASDVSPAVCPECGGRGWIVVSDGSAGRARKCVCRDQDEVQRLLAQSGIPARYRHCRLSKFHTSSDNKREGEQLQRARKLAERSPPSAVPPISSRTPWCGCSPARW